MTSVGETFVLHWVKCWLSKDRDERPRVTCSIVGCGEAGGVGCRTEFSIAVLTSGRCEDQQWPGAAERVSTSSTIRHEPGLGLICSLFLQG